MKTNVLKIGVAMLTSLLFIGYGSAQLTQEQKDEIRKEKTESTLNYKLTQLFKKSQNNKLVLPNGNSISNKSVTLHHISAIVEAEYDLTMSAYVPYDSVVFTALDNMSPAYYKAVIENDIGLENINFTSSLYYEDDLFIYNSSFLSIKYYGWDDAIDTWESIFEYSYTLNEDGYPIKISAYIENGGVLEETAKVDLTRNSENQLTSFIEQYFDGVSFKNSLKFEFQYTGDGDVSRLNKFEWNDTNSEWEPYSEELYQYNSEGQMTQFIERYDYGSGLENSERIIFGYSNGLKSVETRDYWNGSDWYLVRKIQFNYNASDLLAQTISSYESGGAEYLEYRTTYSYNSANKVSSIIDEEWVSGPDSWEYTSKTEVEYDANEGFDQLLYYSFNYGTGEMDLASKLDFTNHSFGKVFMLEELTWNGSVWVNDNYDEMIKYYYTPFEYDGDLSVDEEDMTSVLVYPNPVKDLLNVKLENDVLNSIILLDAMGRVVVSSDNLSTNWIQIPVDELTSGVYYLQVIGKTSSSTKAVMVK